MFICQAPGADEDVILKRFINSHKKYSLLSIKEMLLKETEKGDEFEEIIKECMKNRKNVPGFIIINIILKEMRKIKNDKILIINSFPRTEKQVKSAFECRMQIIGHICICFSDAEILKRARGDKEIIAKALRNYQIETVSAIERLSESVRTITINGNSERAYEMFENAVLNFSN